MKVALCCIGKWENAYIREYVEYYKGVGFSKIFVYDNNEIDGERYEDVIKDYIDEGFVEIVDFRGMTVCQLKAYQDCHNKNGKDYDWIAYFDCDEFIEFVEDKDINEYLSRDIFDKYDMIHLNWMCYSDNGLIGTEDDEKSVLKRFTKEVQPLDFRRSLPFAENNHVKTIVRGSTQTLWRSSPHTPTNKLKCCGNNGVECVSSSPWLKFNHELAYLKHFTTKTATEYMRKVERGFPDHALRRGEREDMLNRFFAYNEDTVEKRKILGLIREDKDNVDIFICAHKNFDTYPNNPKYKIIHGTEKIDVDLEQYEESGDDTLSAKQKLYGEGSRIYWLWKHYDIKDYIGICHYSKYFSFYDDVPNMDDEFKDCDVILPRRLYVGSVYMNYALCHNINDLMLIGGIINKYHNEYIKDFEKVLNDKSLFCCNMFIMKKEDFNKYCEFVFDVLDKFDRAKGFKCDEDVEKHVKENSSAYLKKYEPNSTVAYQSRMDGFLLERLTNVFICHNFKRVKDYPIKTTDSKYNKNLFK